MYHLENLKTIQLTAAKICHEIANYLSIIKFLQEDIKENESAEILELNKSIDLLSYTMDFFRNVYGSSVQPSKAPEIIKTICELKDLNLKFDPEILTECEDNDLINAICLFVYILSKTSRPNETTFVNKSNEVVTITKEGQSALPKSIKNLLNNESSTEDIFNILASHAKHLLNSSKYNVEISTKNKLQIRIWK